VIQIAGHLRGPSHEADLYSEGMYPRAETANYNPNNTVPTGFSPGTSCILCGSETSDSSYWQWWWWYLYEADYKCPKIFAVGRVIDGLAARPQKQSDSRFVAKLIFFFKNYCLHYSYVVHKQHIFPFKILKKRLENKDTSDQII